MTHATHATRRRPFVGALLVAVSMTVAACAQGAASLSPSVPTSPSTAAPATPSAAPVVSPTPGASDPASAAAACAVTKQTTALPSDRLVDLKVTPGATADTLTFVFGNPSLPGPATPPAGTLEVGQPPYTQAGSGAEIEMTGRHVITVRFTGMSLQNDAGEETYTGPTDLKPGLVALRHAVIYDASEGVIGWYVGYDGPGCLTLTRAGTNVTLKIAHS
jgi:hypothetical protein